MILDQLKTPCFQGSIIVFGQYKTWTNSCAVYNEHVKTVAPRNYCRQSIMLFCFWFLIARWVNILNLTV